ncbi:MULTISPECIES: alpha/beta family hydrolase [unclassified Modicisalibacter]|uniref:alpha/beta family hydrolase n=1 Tax=unclassified Modicisalibacter TaxID=2679913 RepID=UPI001CCBC007|nr:alpha/beta fold hydrolase [Modicisalibacter sp. R2A 31.J]MBZ9576550.1 alpha/beta fold hydrolase [Modicisalibacter sp. MOD 31.J]
MAKHDWADRLRESGDARLYLEGLGPLEIAGEARLGRLLLAHGAGAGQDALFMQRLRQALAGHGVQTLAFEFAYMQRMREERRRRPPPRAERLVEEFQAWCEAVSVAGLADPWLGGKSLGGRVASLLAAEAGAPGLILCSYPFHPPGKPARTRLAHWPRLACPTLVLQGSRDPFGTREEVASYTLPACAEVHFLADGEHDWRPRKASGRTQQSLIDEAAEQVARMMATHRSAPARRSGVEGTERR